MPFRTTPLAIRIAAISALMACHSSHADSILEGRLVDAQGQTIYSNALVRIEETGREVLTGQGGLFRIPSLPAGDYTLTVSIGGELVERRQISIVEQPSNQVDILINQSAEPVEEILVVGQAAGLQRALDRQRNADGIISAVNADAIGELPDNNAAEALQRIPGLSIERDQGEGRFVRVRGMGADLNSVAVNGTEIPAPEAGVRAVALDVIPSNLIRSLVVTKTLTPDMDASAIGGAIEIEGISALDHEGGFYNLDASISHDQQSAQNNPKVALVGGNSRDVGDSGRLGVATALSYEGRKFGSDNVETGGSWDDGKLESMEQRAYDIERQRKGAALNIDYQQDTSNRWYLRTLYSQFRDDEQRQALVTTFQDWDTEAGEYDDASRAEGETGHAEVSRELKDRQETQTIIATTFGGEHFIEEWTVDYTLGTSRSEEDEPDTISAGAFVGEFDGVGFTNTRKPNLIAGDDLYDASQYSLDEIEREQGRAQDKMNMAALNLTRDLLIDDYNALVKGGIKTKRRTKDNNRSSWVYEDFGDASDNLSDYSNGTVHYDLDRFGSGVSATSLRQLVASLDSSSAFDAEASSVEDYSIDENIDAAYLMGQIDIDDLQLTTGVRHERTEIRSDGFALDSAGDIISVDHDTRYHHTLPALLARYQLSDDTLVRAAWTNGLARPTFEQIRPNYVIDGSELEIGTPDLVAMRSANLDLGIEHYTGSAGSISAFVFHKNIHNFIYATNLGESGAYSDLGEFDDISTYLNGDTARVLGLELSGSRRLTSLPAPFDGLLVSANATLVNSDASITGYDGSDQQQRNIAMPNQSDLTGNLVLGYERDALSLRLATNYKSGYLVEVGNLADDSEDIHQASETRVDFNASWAVNEQFKLRLDIANLTNEPYYTWQGSERYNAQYESYGPIWSLGFNYSSF